jgi:replicative DNA helicase
LHLANTEVEKAVIGGLLLAPESLSQAAHLSPDDFFDPKCKAIYSSILELDMAGKEISIVTVQDKCRNRVNIEELMQIQNYGVIPSEIGDYVDRIKQYSARRRLTSLSRVVVDMARQDNIGISEIIAKIEDELYAINHRAIGDWVMNLEVMKDYYDVLEERAKNPSEDGLVGVDTGFRDLNRITAGWRPGQLIYLGAVPKMGKTTLALHFALNADVPVLFFSLEMLPIELADRQISYLADDITSDQLRKGTWGEKGWEEINKAMGPLSEAPIGWVQKTGLTVTEIKAICRRFQAEHGLGLVIIDQMDKIHEPHNRGENTAAVVQRKSNKLKALAMDLQVPVITLVQLLDKQVSKRANPRPEHGDIRDSSGPDQDADVVLYLWRPGFYQKNKNDLAEIIVARQRSGESSSIWVRWEAMHTRFKYLPYSMWPKEGD